MSPQTRQPRKDMTDNDTASPASSLLEPTGFDAIEGWAGDDHAAALSCFRVSARRMLEQPYRTRSLGIDSGRLARIAGLALADAPVSANATAARQFFEHHFRPYRIVPGGGGSGFVTGYFEPELPASPVRTDRFTYPLYRRPPDLVDIDDATRPAGMDPSFRFARKTGSGLAEYFDRGEIEAGALTGLGLELAWLESPVDGFFVHIQGSARLAMVDGSVMRVSYAGKSGHPYTAIGALLVETGEMRREDVTMATLRDWLRANPERGSALMARNRSFIFFAESQVSDPALGPVGAAGVPLTAGRSIALDHTVHTFGTPVWIATREPLPDESRPFRRLMIGQDTGSAIVGPARGDLFIGSGEEAGTIAGAIRHRADFVVLVPGKAL